MPAAGSLPTDAKRREEGRNEKGGTREEERGRRNEEGGRRKEIGERHENY